MSDDAPCPFCSLSDDRLVFANDLVVAIRDGYPVSEGHTLVIPRRHVATWFDAKPWEQQALWHAVEAVKEDLDERLSPDGYNVGFNAGRAAGQTVMHLHVHVIPRYAGDVDDPRGGVRGVIPAKQKYDDGSQSQPPLSSHFGSPNVNPYLATSGHSPLPLPSGRGVPLLAWQPPVPTSWPANLPIPPNRAALPQRACSV